MHLKGGKPLEGQMDGFSYFIVFDSLVLGLALSELLGGFALMVRAHALKRLEIQTALMGVLILVSILVEWVDAWNSMQSVTVDLLGLAPPVLLAICYYLAAAVVFPHREADHERLSDYYQERRPFIAGMLVATALLDTVMEWHLYVENLIHRPAVFWIWLLPYNCAIAGCFLALVFVRSRRANILLIVASILLQVVPYLEDQYISSHVAALYGYR